MTATLSPLARRLSLTAASLMIATVVVAGAWLPLAQAAAHIVL
jgi:hypothetical protein